MNWLKVILIAFGIIIAASIAASVYIPIYLEDIIVHNETLATKRLRYLAAEILPNARKDKIVDQNKNGIGEFPFLPTIIANSDVDEWDHGFSRDEMIVNEADGSFIADGYYYNLFLPDGKEGMQRFNDLKQLDDKMPGVNLREQYFALYALPIKRHESGRRIFFVAQNVKIDSFNSIRDNNEFEKTHDWSLLYQYVIGTYIEKLRTGPKQWFKTGPKYE